MRNEVPLHLLVLTSCTPCVSCNLGFLAASKGVNLPQPVCVQRQDNEFTLVLTDLEPDFPNKGTKGTMGIRELKVRSREGMSEFTKGHKRGRERAQEGTREVK